MVLNENIHEFDHLEKHGIKNKIKEIFKKKESKDEIIERLEKELQAWDIRYKKLNTRYKNALKMRIRKKK